ncbi:hypothetical protein HY642_04620 [Candidatus Woesearchaeota archaeon]|nr:hypothetical protein [Candidatus Woesearchaeota archaeon]
MAPTITTGVDRLMQRIDAVPRLSIREAAKKLNVSEQTIQDWATFLEEEGLITIEYALTNVYMVRKKLTAKERQERLKTVALEKGTFEKRSQSLLTYLDRLEQELKRLDELFSGMNLKRMASAEISMLKRLEQEKARIDRELVDVRTGMMAKMEQITTHLQQDQGKLQAAYDKMFKELGDAAQIIRLEQEEMDAIQANEAVLEKLLGELGRLVSNRVERIIAAKKDALGKSGTRMKSIAKRYEAMRDDLASDAEHMHALIAESAGRREMILRSQQDLVRRLQEHSDALKSQNPKQVERLLQQRSGIADALRALYHEEQLLKARLLKLIGLGSQLGAGQFEKAEAEVKRLTKELDKLTERRDYFEDKVRQILDRMK